MSTRLERFFATPDDLTLTLLRVVAGAVMFPHGAQKLLGWFGGRGFSATMHGMQEHLHLPAFVVLLVILGESLGALGLVFGVASRFCAFGLLVTMLGALDRHLAHGFFMNWGGRQAGEGFEFHLLYIALTLPILFRGGGALSVDRWLADKLDTIRRP